MSDEEIEEAKNAACNLALALLKEQERINVLISMLTPTFVQFTESDGSTTWALIDDSQFDEAKPVGWDDPKRYPTAREAIDAHIAAKKSGGNPYV